MANLFNACYLSVDNGKAMQMLETKKSRFSIKKCFLASANLAQVPMFKPALRVFSISTTSFELHSYSLAQMLSLLRWHVEGLCQPFLLKVNDILEG